MEYNIGGTEFLVWVERISKVFNVLLLYKVTTNPSLKKKKKKKCRSNRNKKLDLIAHWNQNSKKEKILLINSEH